MRVPAGLKASIQAVFDHRRGAGGCETTAAEVRMCVDLEFKTAAPQRERRTTGDELTFVLNTKSNASRGEVSQRREVVHKRIFQLGEPLGVLCTDAFECKAGRDRLLETTETSPTPLPRLEGDACPRTQVGAPMSTKQRSSESRE